MEQEQHTRFYVGFGFWVFFTLPMCYVLYVLYVRTEQFLGSFWGVRCKCISRGEQEVKFVRNF